MKRIATVISVLMASMLFSAITNIGAENYPAPFGSYGKGVKYNQKNECLLVAKNCATESSTVRQRVMDLRKEISKGYKVYTPTELNILKEQLKWIEYDSIKADIT
ncbi:MAG TPA: hypothetical protein VN642_10270 [Dongiaceae bacterium]|nr:hypothetical protein [Dongiaceae bacterium]